MIRRLVGGAVLVATPTVIVAFATMSTAARDELVAHGISCVFRDVTGAPCPFCGMTHALAQLSALDWAGAFRAHPLWPLVVAAHVLAASMLLRDRSTAPRWSTDPRVLLATIAVTWMVNVIHRAS